MTAIGAQIVMARLREHAREEAIRTKWVGVGPEGAEWLFVRCGECEQPHARQRVVRLKNEELRHWQESEQRTYREYSRVGLWGFPLMVVVVLAGLIIGMELIDSSTVGALAGMLPSFVYGFFLARKLSRRYKEVNQQRQQILAGFKGCENLTPEQVGTFDEPPREFVLLPENGTTL